MKIGKVELKKVWPAIKVFVRHYSLTRNSGLNFKKSIKLAWGFAKLAMVWS